MSCKKNSNFPLKVRGVRPRRPWMAWEQHFTYKEPSRVRITEEDVTVGRNAISKVENEK